MTFLFKFIDSGFLLTLGLILLISGAIMLYCYRRLNLLEKSVIEHGKILQNFILNYNVQMQNLSCLNNIPFNNNNSEKANIINNNEDKEEEIKKINLEEKIYVSDDDNEESDNVVSDNEESDNEESDNEESDNEESVKLHSDNEKINNLSISKENIEEDLGNLEKIELKNSVFSNSDEENFMNNLPISLETFNIDLNNKSKIINLESDDQVNENDVTETKNYSKMKVDDLKSLVVTKNILDNESVQKMKKKNLVKLLQNN